MSDDEQAMYVTALVTMSGLVRAFQRSGCELRVAMAILPMVVGDLAWRLAGEGVGPERVNFMLCENVRRGVYSQVMRDTAGSA